MDETIEWIEPPERLEAARRRDRDSSRRAVRVVVLAGVPAGAVVGLVAWRFGIRDGPPRDVASTVTALAVWFGGLALLTMTFALQVSLNQTASGRSRAAATSFGAPSRVAVAPAGLTLGTVAHPWGDVTMAEVIHSRGTHHLRVMVGPRWWKREQRSVFVGPDVDVARLAALISRHAGRGVGRSNLDELRPSARHLRTLALLSVVHCVAVAALVGTDALGPRSLTMLLWLVLISPAHAYALTAVPRTLAGIAGRLHLSILMAFGGVTLAIFAVATVRLW